MKKMTRVLLTALFTWTLVTSSALAIYTGEEQEEPKEGEVQILKMVEQPEIDVINAEDTEIYETTALESEPTENAEKVPVLYIVGGLVIIGTVSFVLLKRKKVKAD